MIIGIDFGTSKSVVAVTEAGEPAIISDLQGHRSIPSLVMVAPDERLYIGWEALNHPSRYQSEHFTISSIKRLMGKTGETGWGRFRTYPQEVSALILGRLKIQAEAYYGEPIRWAVIAVPAHFDINQRWATMQAAEIAGLKALRLLNEATTAVVAYSWLRKKAEGVALVFDFGGGTLDVSIVEFGAGVYEVKATAGHDRLGGDDFDQIIVDHLLENIKQRLGASVELSPVQQLVLKEAAAQAKIDLSSTSTTRIYLPGFLRSANRHYDLDVSLDRGTFESLCSMLFDRAETVLRTAMGDYHRGDPLTDVLIIGGTSRIPYIRESVRKITGLEPHIGVDPEVGVAQGASILAGILDGEVKDVLLLDVVPGTYSVAVKEDVASPVIERNTTIPTVKSQIFTTTEDGQTEITVRVFQGDRPVASQNTFVGVVRLSGLPPAPRGIPQIEVVFEIDVDNTLRVSAKDKATGREVQAMMEAPYRLNPAQIKVLQRKVEQELQTLQQREWEARERERDEMARNAAIIFAKKIEGFLAVHGGSLEARQASLLADGVQLIRDYLSWNVSYKDLQALVSSVCCTYEDTILVLMERAAKSVADSPELAQWAADATSTWQTPTLLGASFEDFERRFGDVIESIVTLFQREDAGSRERLKQKLLAKLRGSPTAVLCLAIILSRFAGLHTRIQGLSITQAHDRLLLGIFLLGELSKSNRKEVRQAAAQEIFNACKGTDCFFLLEYLIAETDPEVTSWLERCLREIPGGAWFKLFLVAEPAERERLTTNAVALREVRRDLVRALKDPSSEVQLAALEALEELGVQACLPDLLPFLALKLDDEVKIKLIMLLASSRHEQVIVPLLKTIADKSLAVRCAILASLEGYRDLMAPNVGRFFELAQRLIGQGQPITLREKFFLWKFAREHKELSEVVKMLRGKKQSADSRQ